MGLWLRRLWALFKWSMVLLGIVVGGILVVAKQRTVPKQEAVAEQETEEVLLLSGKNCEFSFSVPKGQWRPARKVTTYSHFPVLVDRNEAENPKLFLSLNRIWPDSKSPGGWELNTSGKCQTEPRHIVRTTGGKEAQLFLSSNCDLGEASGSSTNESPFRENTLYGYVPYKGGLADFIYLSSSDKALILKHENLMVKAFESHSTSSPQCVASRTTIKKIEVLTP